MDHKSNVPLYIGIAIPVVMIIFIAISIYVPGSFSKPKYDFLYTKHDSSYDRSIQVRGNKIVMECVDYNDAAAHNFEPKECTPEPDNKLFVYDTETDTAREIAYDDAKKLTLNPYAKSSDGYEVSGYAGGGDLFSGLFGGSSSRDYNALYLKGHNRSRKLTIPAVNESLGLNPYAPNQFLGWIEQTE